MKVLLDIKDGMGREEGSGWGTRVYLWQIHVDIWQNQYNIIKLKNKIKNKIREIQFSSLEHVICTDFIDLYNSLMEISLRFPKDVS